MKVFFQIAYFLVGLVQFFAVWDGVKYFFGLHGFLGNFVSFIGASFIAYIPIVGSIIGVFAATTLWHWDSTKAIILFFWYVPIFIMFAAISYSMSRR